MEIIKHEKLSDFFGIECYVFEDDYSYFENELRNINSNYVSFDNVNFFIKNNKIQYF